MGSHQRRENRRGQGNGKNLRGYTVIIIFLGNTNRYYALLVFVHIPQTTVHKSEKSVTTSLIDVIDDIPVALRAAVCR